MNESYDYCRHAVFIFSIFLYTRINRVKYLRDRKDFIVIKNFFAYILHTYGWNVNENACSLWIIELFLSSMLLKHSFVCVPIHFIIWLVFHDEKKIKLTFFHKHTIFYIFLKLQNGRQDLDHRFICPSTKSINCIKKILKVPTYERERDEKHSFWRFIMKQTLI